MTYDGFRFNDMSQGVVAVPLWSPQLGYSVGLAILAVAFLDELVHVQGHEGAAPEPRAEGGLPEGGRAADPGLAQEGRPDGQAVIDAYRKAM